MLYVARFVTVFLLSGPVFCVGLRRLPGERRFFKAEYVPRLPRCRRLVRPDSR